MKKALAILLAAMMTLSLCACGGSNSGSTADAGQAKEEAVAEPAAEAAEPAEAAVEEVEPAAEAAETTTDEAPEADDDPYGLTETFETMGFTVLYPPEFQNAKGTVYPQMIGEIGEVGSGIRILGYLYATMPKDEFYPLLNKNDKTDEEMLRLSNSMYEFLYVCNVDGGRGAKEIVETLGNPSITEDMFTEVGKVEDVAFYVLDGEAFSQYFDENGDQEYRDEYYALHDSLIEAFKKAEYYTPVKQGTGMIGQTIEFETTDVDGNAVRSEELFAQNKITMVNIWATWCGPCISELAELGEMHRRLAEKNVAVVGICLDADTELETCKELIAENGIDYVNLLPYDDVLGSLQITGIPTSYFVGSDGKILTTPVIGAPASMSTYEDTIDQLLGEGASVEAISAEASSVDPGVSRAAGDSAASASSAASVQANDEGVYRVIVTDPEGKPVQGASIQFCSDTMCLMEKTDENGVASFAHEEGVYTVHVLRVPGGYEANDEEYVTADTFCDVSIVLQKK